MKKPMAKKFRLIILFFLLLVIASILDLLSPNSKDGFYDPITTPMKSNYTMKINELQKLDNTNILLDEVLLDFNAVYIKSHIWGNDKLVAVEVRKSTNVNSSICALTDLWIGSKFKFSPSAKGNFILSFKENKCTSPLYLSFHLSSGKSTTFKVEDTNNVKSVAKIVPINKTLKFDLGKKEPLYLKFTNLTKGITYTKLEVNTNFYPKDMEISLIVDNKELKSTSGGYGGGVIGSLAFDPIDSNDLKVKVKNIKTSQEQFLPIKIS